MGESNFTIVFQFLKFTIFIVDIIHKEKQILTVISEEKKKIFLNQIFLEFYLIFLISSIFLDYSYQINLSK